MERWQNRVAVVTGASSGIGQAIAKDLVTAGFRVVPLGRRQERLDKNRSALSPDLQKRCFPRKCDISVESDVKATFNWIEKTLGGVDVLVNNAGLVRPGNLADMDASSIDDVLNTNVKGLIYCTQAAVKSMKARNINGHIVHINSVAGHQVVQLKPGDSFNIYTASKYAVTAINETLRLELRDMGTKIKTTSVSPGVVMTEIKPEDEMNAFEAWLNPEDISQAVLYAIATPPHVQIHEITIKPVGEMF